MPAFSVEDIVRGTGGALLGGDLGIAVSGVSIDSRSLGIGEAFFAIRGERLDGHAFLREAVGRGAACLVVDTVSDDLPPGMPVVLVDDTTRALGRLGAWHRARFAIPVAAVTGSNGKTTTKEMMAAVLATRGPVLKPESSFNNQWGLPLTLLKLTAEHTAAAIEIGTNHPGEIAALAGIARPTIAAVTTVSSAHTEFLGSLDDVQREKSALVQALPDDGAAVLNADDPRVRAMAAQTRARVWTVSARSAADVCALGAVRESSDGIGFEIETAEGRRPVRLRFSGRHNVTNALASAAVGSALNLSGSMIAQGLGRFRPAAMRSQVVTHQGVHIINDCYNANPASMKAALQLLAQWSPARERIAVLGDMLELGPETDRMHRDVGQFLATQGLSRLIVSGTLGRDIAEGARQGGMTGQQINEMVDAAAAADHLKRIVRQGDVVLVKGSRGMKMEQIVQALTGMRAVTKRAS